MGLIEKLATHFSVSAAVPVCYLLLLFGLIWLLGHHPHADQLRLIFQHFHLSFSFTVLSTVSVSLVFLNNILKRGSRGIVKNIIWKFEGCRKIKCTCWKTYLGCGCIKVSGGFLSLS